jgi:hypothetical protein
MRIRLSLLLFLILCCVAYSQSSPSGESSTAQPHNSQPGDSQPDLALQSSVYVKVQLDSRVKVPALKSGDVIEGKLAQDVYSGDRELFPAGSSVRLIVDKLGRRRRIPNDHWPWVVKAFTPRHENYPLFRSATITLADGMEIPLRISLISLNRETEIRARSKTKAGKPSSAAANPTALPADTGAEAGSKDTRPAASRSKSLGPVLTLEAANPTEALMLSRQAPGANSSSESLSGENAPPTASSSPMTLAAGTGAKLILLGGVSASKSRPGDSFQARLVEPVRLDSKVILPEGTLLEGKVVSRTPPRMLSRAGSILLVFTNLTVPGKPGVPVVASVSAADLDQRSHTKIDPEGKLHGDRPGKAWMAINIGVTGGIAKEADDTIQLIIEAVVSTATDASTAGVGRIVATCASGLFMLTRHGRDVVLPKYTEVNIVFDRPLLLDHQSPSMP